MKCPEAFELDCKCRTCAWQKAHSDALKRPKPSPMPRAWPTTREELEEALIPILEKWHKGNWLPHDKMEMITLYAKARGWEPIHLEWSTYLYDKCKAHFMTIRQMETILNILEAE